MTNNPRKVMQWSLEVYRDAKQFFKTGNRISDTSVSFNQLFKDPLAYTEEEALDRLKLVPAEESFLQYDKDDPTSGIPYQDQLKKGALYEHILAVNHTGESLDAQVFNREVLRVHAEFLRFLHKETYNRTGGV